MNVVSCILFTNIICLYCLFNASLGVLKVSLCIYYVFGFFWCYLDLTWPLFLITTRQPCAVVVCFKQGCRAGAQAILDGRSQKILMVEAEPEICVPVSQT